MDRSTTIGYVLIFLLFIGFFYFNQQNVEEIEQEETKTEAASVDTPKAAENEVSLDTAILDSVATTEVVEEKLETLSNKLLQVDLLTRKT